MSALQQAWPMPSAPRPIVILGTGGIVSDAHLPAYRKAGFTVAGLYDLDRARAEALAATGAGPFTLIDADPAALAQLRNDTLSTLQEVASGNVQPPAVAERWAKDDLSIRLTCLESWVTERILESAPIRDVTHLSQPGMAPKICRLFEFSDAIRDMRKLAHTSVNKTMAVESLLWRWARS